MTKWEYMGFTRTREFVGGAARAWNVDLVAQLTQLGEQGWELVAIEPSCDSANTIVAHGAGFGATTSDTWVFKRPKTG